MKKIVFSFSLIFFLIFGTGVLAARLGEGVNFYIDENYDVSGRTDITAVLVKTAPKLYFYIDKKWWESQVYLKQEEILNSLKLLSQEFDNRIYPNLTSVFGSEWKPGIDGDERITVLFHQMKEGVGGYFRTADEYLRIQAPESNEREMVYLPTAQIDNFQKLKVFLAHEFTHLIVFNQKERRLGIPEEVWLNEARAEYSPSLLGYDNNYEGSNLQGRVKIFLEEPSDPITEWQNKKEDYGALDVFTQYLVDHYGVGILIDSLKSDKVGIPSINEALAKNGFKKDFSQIFTDWTIAVFINNCSLGENFCYLNKNLKDLKITPSINFLPFTNQSSLSVTDVIKNWSGNWQKFIGGKGVLKFEFKGLAGLNFKVPYLVQDKDGNYRLNFLKLDSNETGQTYISDFGSKNVSLTIIPSLQTKITGFDGLDPTYSYSFTISTIENTKPKEETELINELLARIDALKAEIAKVQAQIKAILESRSLSCKVFRNNLYFGMRDNKEVRCLQEFLKKQGPEIYPEGLVTGNFLYLTKAAVIRFQEKYSSEILAPWGLAKGTGFVGSTTRRKINQLLSQK